MPLYTGSEIKDYGYGIAWFSICIPRADIAEKIAEIPIKCTCGVYADSYYLYLASISLSLPLIIIG